MCNCDRSPAHPCPSCKVKSPCKVRAGINLSWFHHPDMIVSSDVATPSTRRPLHCCDHRRHTTYWFIDSDDSMKLNNVGVQELSHDGCLLEKLDFLVVVRGLRLKHLDSYLHATRGTLPNALAHRTKLTSSKVLDDSTVKSAQPSSLN